DIDLRRLSLRLSLVLVIAILVAAQRVYQLVDLGVFGFQLIQHRLHSAFDRRRKLRRLLRGERLLLFRKNVAQDGQTLSRRRFPRRAARPVRDGLQDLALLVVVVSAAATATLITTA